MFLKFVTYQNFGDCSGVKYSEVTLSHLWRFNFMLMSEIKLPARGKEKIITIISKNKAKGTY